MKKLLLFVGIAGMSIAANAAYLYWQVGAKAEDTYAVPDATTWDVGKLYAVDSTGSKYLVGQATGTGNYVTGNSVGTTVPSGPLVVSDLGDYYGSGYSYYVELWNSSSQIHVANSARESYNSMTSYIDTGSTTASLVAVPTGLSTWHAASYTAAPEPTSAILMLFGAAFLGLKRKNRSLA